MDIIFDKKKRRIDNDGDEYIDLSQPTIDVDRINVYGISRVGQDESARLDFFTWNKVGQTFDAIDTVMYANNLFNPFSIEEGDELYLCSHNDSLYSFNTDVILPDGNSEQKTFNEEVKAANDKIKSKPDANRRERLKALASQYSNGVSEVKAANAMKKGQTAKVYTTGKIILGTTIKTK